MARPTPGFVIIGGINGCGKSTLASAAIEDSPDLFLGQEAINPDVITKQIADTFPSLAGDAANLVGVEKAEKLAWKAIAEGQSVAIETVLSSDKFVPLVDAARLRGFRTRLVFISLPTVELAIERVAQRVKAGGHDVPREKMLSRWGRTHDNLFRFLRQVDDVFVFSNADAQPKLVAERVGRDSLISLYLPDELPIVTAGLEKLSRSTSLGSRVLPKP